MKREGNPTASVQLLSGAALLGGTLAASWRSLPQLIARALVRLRRVPWQLLLLCLGLVVQAGLLLLVWRLVDLCIDLFEAWVILARYATGA